MSVFKVELKKVVDDSYDIEIGYNLKDQLVEDLETGLLGSVKKLAVITDSNVRDLYAKPICEKLIHAGYKVDLFVFPAGEKSKTRKTKERIEDAMLEKGYRRDCAIIAIGGGVVTDLAGFVAGTYGRGVPFINYATTLLAAADASFHIEADISAGANNVGYEIGTYVPQLTVDYEIAPADANAEKKEGVNYAAGTFMDMNASDGPHYGANVKLTEAGSYKVKFTIKSPEAKGWVLHTDAETGVDGRFWSEPLVAEWDWDYVPQEWNN